MKKNYTFKPLSYHIDIIKDHLVDYYGTQPN